MSFKNKIAAGLSLALAAAAPLAAHAQSQQPNPRWGGFYGGVNLGGEWQNTQAGVGLSSSYGGFSGNGSGFLGGVQGGYNYLFGPVLLGGEVDFQGSTLTSGFSGGAGRTALGGQTSMPWFSTFRARAGYTFGSVMPYVTGGAVWGQQNMSGYDSANGGAFSASNNYWTWTVGGGIEGFLTDRLSAKLEYLYIGTPSTPLSSPATVSINETQSTNVLRVGLNYHF